MYICICVCAYIYIYIYIKHLLAGCVTRRISIQLLTRTLVVTTLHLCRAPEHFITQPPQGNRRFGYSQHRDCSTGWAHRSPAKRICRIWDVVKCCLRTITATFSAKNGNDRKKDPMWPA